MARYGKSKVTIYLVAVVTASLFLCMGVARSGLGVPTALAQEEEETKRVALFVLPASASESKAALIMSRVLRENTTGLTNVKLVAPAPVLNASALPELQTMVEEAYKAMNAKNVEEAMAGLNRAKPLLEQILPIVPVRTVALFYKAYGVGLALSGNMAEARSAIELSLTLWRDQSNLEYAYSVETLKLFTSVSTDLENRPSTKLTVETTPENAVVVVDAREPGQSPATVTNLTAGTHLVKIVLDGHDQWAGFVRLAHGDENRISIALRAITEKQVFDQRLVAVSTVIKGEPEDATQALLDLKEFLGADELLALECSVVGESYELSGFHVKADNSVFPAKRTLDRDASFLAGVREFLSGLFESFYEIARKTEGLGGPPIDPVLLQKAGITTQQTATVFDPDNPVFPSVDLGKKKKEKVTKKWWFWTATVGGAVVVAGVAVLIWALSDSGDSSGGPSGTCEICPNPM